MKFTVLFVTLLCISSPWDVLAKKADESKDKREAPVSYPSGGYSGQSYQSSQVYNPSQSYQPAPASHGDASAISIGAGYSIGGAKPSYNFGNLASGAALQASSGGLPSSGHATIQLPPITLQPNQGSYVASDLSQLMSQLSHGYNSGSLSLQPSNSVAEFHTEGEGTQTQGAQEHAIQQYYSKLPQYNLAGSVAGSPSYITDAKGLSSYGSTGPVLFNPNEGQSGAPSFSYSGLTSGHTQQPEGTLSYTGSGNTLAGQALSGYGNSFGGSLKGLSSGQIAPGKGSFQPSVFLGASVASDVPHGSSGASGSYSAPSFGGLGAGHAGLTLSSAGHAPSFGGSSGKLIAPSFPGFKSESYGGSLESLGALSSGGHFASPPGTTYGFPTSSYNSLAPTGATHSATATRPYYVSSPKHLSSGGSSAYRSSGPSHFGSKYSFGAHGSSRYSPKDSHGAHSETSYNTIKYSEELKPRIH